MSSANPVEGFCSHAAFIEGFANLLKTGFQTQPTRPNYSICTKPITTIHPIGISPKLRTSIFTRRPKK